MELVLRNVSDTFEFIPIGFKVTELTKNYIHNKLGKFSGGCFHECLLRGTFNEIRNV